MLFWIRGRPSDNDRSRFNVSHRWYLPGVRCEVCGRVWSTTGVAYPTLRLPQHLAAWTAAQTSPVNRSELRLVIDQLVDVLPGHLQLGPGTAFGPLQGDIDCPPKSAVWLNPWTLVVDGHTLNQLIQCMGELRGCEILTRDGIPTGVYEIEVRPAGRQSNPVVAASCRICEYQKLDFPDSLVLDRDSVDPNLDLFRLGDFPTLFVASERATKCLSDAGLSFSAEPVKIAAVGD